MELKNVKHPSKPHVFVFYDYIEDDVFGIEAFTTTGEAEAFITSKINDDERFRVMCVIHGRWMDVHEVKYAVGHKLSYKD